MLLDGYRCCSDHVEVFMALAAWLGLESREVGFDDHLVAEVFLPRERRWVMVGPLFGVYAADSAGRPASLVQHWHGLRAGPATRILALEPRAQALIERDSRFQIAYYSELPQAKYLRVTREGDLVAWAQAERSLRFLARPVRLFGLYIVGRKPWYIGIRSGAAWPSPGLLNLTADATVFVVMALPILGAGALALAAARLRQ